MVEQYMEEFLSLMADAYLHEDCVAVIVINAV